MSHGGNVGDLIWGIPTMKALAKDQQVDLYLKANVPGAYPGPHPCGKVQMTTEYAENIAELLRTQSMFSKVELCQPGQRVDYDLDAFRRTAFPKDRGHIALWYAHAFMVAPRIWEPWLKLDVPKNNLILINRTKRYRNPRIHYTFLVDKPNVKFVGLEDEYQDFCRAWNGVPWLSTRNHLELAQAIAGCRLFVGNQSTAYALAEGLGVPRIVEVCPQVPNAFPVGPGGWQAWDYDLFRQTVEYLLHETKNDHR